MTSTPDEPVRDEDLETAEATPAGGDADLGYSGGQGDYADEAGTDYLEGDAVDGTFGEGQGPART